MSQVGAEEWNRAIASMSHEQRVSVDALCIPTKKSRNPASDYTWTGIGA